MEQGILSELRLRVEAIFQTKMYKEACIKRYNHTWDHLYEYMKTNAIKFYSRQTGMDFLNEWHRNKSFNELTHRQQERVRHVEVLTNVLETGTIRRNRHVNKEFVFEGELGKPFNCFIESESHRKKESSLTRYKERINNLYRFLQEEDLTLATFDAKLALKYIGKLDREKSSPDRDNIVMTTRVFFRFLCDNKLLTDNNSEKWMALFKIKYVRAKKIPSTYTREEVEAIIESIDKSHPQGKRDHAMILLAARYGLRVSDINGLRFCNLDWECNRIVLIQQKTQRKVSLPLSEEVGGAIIEYIRFGRPSVDLPYVFITAHAPYKELGSNTMTASIADYMRAAGIDSTRKRHGPHALRHSLATNLLKANEQLPVISEILGHKSTDSTMTYLRVDTDLLRRCALDVPFVPSTFYEKLYE